MKIIYELNKQDIEDIIAEHFKLAPNSVNIETNIVTVGLGKDKHQVAYVKARIEKEDN